MEDHLAIFKLYPQRLLMWRPRAAMPLTGSDDEEPHVVQNTANSTESLIASSTQIPKSTQQFYCFNVPSTKPRQSNPNPNRCAVLPASNRTRRRQADGDKLDGRGGELDHRRPARRLLHLHLAGSAAVQWRPPHRNPPPPRAAPLLAPSRRARLQALEPSSAASTPVVLSKLHVKLWARKKVDSHSYGTAE